MNALNAQKRKITIGGLAGTGKGDVSKMIAEALGWTGMSAGGIFRMWANQRGVSLAELQRQTQIDPSIDRKLDDFTKDFGAKETEFVFEGRLPWFFIPDSYKVKLTCDLLVRIERIAQRDKVEHSVARALTFERERIIRDQYLRLYGIEDFTDPRYYNQVVDTTGLTQEEVAGIIMHKYCQKIGRDREAVMA